MRILGNFHDNIFDSIRIWNHMKKETFCFSRSLYKDFAIIKHGRNDSFYGDGHILNIWEIEFAYMTIEQAYLFDINDTFVGDNPNIEVIVNPGEKTKEPNKNKKGIFQKSKESRLVWAQEVGEKKRENQRTRNKEKSKKNKKKKMRKNIEPVTMNHFDNLFILSLTSEVITMKCVGHKMYLERTSKEVIQWKRWKIYKISKKKYEKDRREKNGAEKTRATL